MEERKAKGQFKGSITIPMAEDLQRTKLSEALEAHIQGRVEDYIEECCREKAEREVCFFVFFVLFLLDLSNVHWTSLFSLVL
jgi:hypothetical protein